MKLKLLKLLYRVGYGIAIFYFIVGIANELFKVYPDAIEIFYIRFLLHLIAAILLQLLWIKKIDLAQNSL